MCRNGMVSLNLLYQDVDYNMREVLIRIIYSHDCQNWPPLTLTLLCLQHWHVAFYLNSQKDEDIVQW